jgi:hypothetical protein
VWRRLGYSTAMPDVDNVEIIRRLYAEFLCTTQELLP